MKPPLIRKPPQAQVSREKGVTMVLVAVAMVAIIAMAALSIDVVTLYLAREEAQGTADAAALAAAKVLSTSGFTGDPLNVSTDWSLICGGSTSLATRAAKAVANQNAVGSVAPASVTVTYSLPGGLASSTCTALAGLFPVNSLVTVQIQQTSLPTFFSRIWGNSGNTVSATATAEVFNPSNSIPLLSTITPVQPRCVKPWAIPNQDPLHNIVGGVGLCTGGSLGPSGCAKIIGLTDGSIVNKGISLNGSGVGGIVGETFWLNPDCRWSQSPCAMRINPPQANYNNGSGFMRGGTGTSANLVFAPVQVGVTTPVAVPSCATGDVMEEAIGGCDSPENYSCGVPPPTGTNVLDLNRNPDASIATAVSCLIHQTDTSDLTKTSGQDYFSPFGEPSAYPFQILAGASTPLVTSAALPKDTPINTSPSIVSLPIYDETTPLTSGNASNPVTFVGFLQVFINAVDQYGNINVTVLNVSGCGNGSGLNVAGTAVAGTSPVPIRLITPP